MEIKLTMTSEKFNGKRSGIGPASVVKYYTEKTGTTDKAQTEV